MSLAGEGLAMQASDFGIAGLHRDNARLGNGVTLFQ
jgi:hypothetical protein